MEEFFWRIFLEEIFWRNFMGEIFWEDFFREDFFRGFFWEDYREDFFGRNSLFTLLKSAKVFEYEWNLCFCQDFGVMQGRKEGSRIFNP